VHPGDSVTLVDAVPVAEAVDRLLPAPREAGAADRDWALRHVLAGPRTGTFLLGLGGREPRAVEIERDGNRVPAAVAPVSARLIGDERNIGYVRLRSFSSANVAALDAGLESIAAARGLILDLRGLSHDDRAATLAVLARFAVREDPWQLREARNGKRMADRISPRATHRIKGPLIVLVDRWTAGEGEALAAGLAAVASARLAGTPMAGLRGELREVRLPHSGIRVRFPAEKVLTPDGTPRESLRPHVPVDLAAPNGGPGDPILYQALKALEKN
jgi:carboxyl-terminal processing protease